MNYANHYGYSDVNPYEIVRHVSPTTIEVRAMSAVRANPEDKLGFTPGGFFGHCDRQTDQKWVITPRLDAPVIRIRLSKAKRKAGWFNKGRERFVLSDEPRKFYDYNF